MTLIDILLDYGANPTITNADGDNLIHLAAIHAPPTSEYEELIGLLLRLHVDINAQNNDGKTPLMESVEHDEYVMIFLIENGADWKIKDSDGKTFVDILECMIVELQDNDYHESYSSLFTILEAKGAEISHLWQPYDFEGGCSEGASSPTPEPLPSGTPWLATHLHEYHHHYPYRNVIEVVEDLQNIDQICECVPEELPKEIFRNESRETILHVTPRLDLIDAPLLEPFFQNPENINSQDCDGRTPLHYIFEQFSDIPNLVNTLDKLISMGASPDVKDNLGLTPLYSFFEFCHTNEVAERDTIFAKLVSTMKDFSSKDIHGRNLAHQCVRWNQVQYLDILAGHGVDIHAKDSHGKNIVHISAEYRWLSRHYKFFLNYKIDLNAVDWEGNTPAHMFYKHGPNFEIFEGLNLRIENFNGISPASYNFDFIVGQLKRREIIYSASPIALMRESPSAKLNLRFGDQNFLVHEQVLKTRSPKFLDQYEKLRLTVSPELVTQLLIYVYKDCLQSTDKDLLQQLCTLATQLEINTLSVWCQFVLLQASLSADDFLLSNLAHMPISSSLSTDIAAMNSQSPDITLRASDGQEIKLCSVVLESRCPYFHIMQTSGMAASSTVDMDVSYSTLQTMVRYFETNTFEQLQHATDGDEIVALMLAADKYLLPHLVGRCVKWLENHLDESNVDDIKEYASVISSTYLLEKCTQFKGTTNTVELVPTLLEFDPVNFFKLVAETLQDFNTGYECDFCKFHGATQTLQFVAEELLVQVFKRAQQKLNAEGRLNEELDASTFREVVPDVTKDLPNTLKPPPSTTLVDLCDENISPSTLGCRDYETSKRMFYQNYLSTKRYIKTPTPMYSFPTPESRAKMIFCIHPGRCGSFYLASLLALAGISAFHEPVPTMSGTVLKRALKNQDISMDLEHKMAAITDLMINKDVPPNSKHIPIYAETSSMFIKSFSSIVNAHNIAKYWGGVHFYFIILRRDMAETLRSQHRLGWLSHVIENKDLTSEEYDHIRWEAPGSRGFVYTPEEGQWTSLVPPVAPDSELTTIEKLVAYNFDVEARSQKFINDNIGHSNFTFLQVPLPALNTVEGCSELFEKLGVTPDPIYKEAIGRKINSTRSGENEADIKFYEDQIAAFRRKCDEKKITTPTYDIPTKITGAFEDTKSSSESKKRKRKK